MSADMSAVEDARQPPTRCLTYEEFLDWCDEDTWAEWVDGAVQMVSPASKRHANLATFLLTVLRYYSDAWNLGVVYGAPFQMHLPEPVNRGREPDILFVRAAHVGRIRTTYLDGPADLVVEIISPESIGRDRGEKFVEYEQSGVEEYWLIDPEREQAEFYQLGPDGKYRLAFGGGHGEYRSRVLSDFRMSVEQLWLDPLPKVASVLKALDIPS